MRMQRRLLMANVDALATSVIDLIQPLKHVLQRELYARPLYLMQCGRFQGAPSNHQCNNQALLVDVAPALDHRSSLIGPPMDSIRYVMESCTITKICLHYWTCRNSSQMLLGAVWAKTDGPVPIHHLNSRCWSQDLYLIRRADCYSAECVVWVKAGTRGGRGAPQKKKKKP